LGSDLDTRGRAHRARAATRAGLAGERRRNAQGGERARARQRLGAAPRARAPRREAPHAHPPPGRARPAQAPHDLQPHPPAALPFNAPEPEGFADCSSAWLMARVVAPRSIDAEVDAKLRGSVAHSALYRFFSGLQKELGTPHLDESNADAAVTFVHACLDEA